MQHDTNETKKSLYSLHITLSHKMQYQTIQQQ